MRRLPPRIVGFAGLADTATNAANTVSSGFNTADNYTGGLLSSQANVALQNLVAGLPPDVQSAIAEGQKVVQGGTPAFDLIDKLAGGGVPTVPEVSLAFAGLVSLVNPVAGALTVAAGEAVQGFIDGMKAVFNALGFYPPPPPTYGYTGLHRCVLNSPCENPIPLPPAADGTLDPNWIFFDNALDLLNFKYGAHYYKAPNGTVWPPYQPDVSSRQTNDNYFNLWYYCLLRDGAMTPERFGQKHSVACGSSPSPNFWGGNNSYNCPTALGRDACSQAAYQVDLANSPSPFEIFFNKMMVKNLEYWGNGLPSIPPRTLLAAAQVAWNAKYNQGVDPTMALLMVGLVNAQAGLPTRGPVDLGKNNKVGSIQLNINAGTLIYWPAPNPDYSKIGVEPAYGIDHQSGIFDGSDIPKAPSNVSQSCFDGFSTTIGGSTVSAILGPWGGLLDPRTPIESDAPRLTINAGSLVGSVRTSSTGPSDSAIAAAERQSELNAQEASAHATMVASGGGAANTAKTIAVAAPVAAAVGTLAYSYATGQAVDQVVKRVWRALQRLFR